MKKQSKTLDAYFSHEIVIERSRFITHLQPTDTVLEARDFIAKINKKHHDATHNCTAYIIQSDTIIQKANDDGEPSGTAGMPMLQAMLQQDMVNVTAVVTRYFGGIKLGAGGLIRAYSHSITEALHAAPLMVYTTFVVVAIEITYDELNKLYYLQESTQNFIILETIYDANIKVKLSLLETNITSLEETFTQILLRPINFIILEQEIRKTPL